MFECFYWFFTTAAREARVSVGIATYTGTYRHFMYRAMSSRLFVFLALVGCVLASTFSISSYPAIRNSMNDHRTSDMI